MDGLNKSCGKKIGEKSKFKLLANANEIKKILFSDM